MIKKSFQYYVYLTIMCSIAAVITPIDLLSGVYLFIPPVICQEFNEDYLHGSGAYDAYLKDTDCDGFGGSSMAYGSLIYKVTGKSYSIFAYDSDADLAWQWLGPDQLQVTVNKIDYDPHAVNRVGPITIGYITRDQPTHR